VVIDRLDESGLV